MERRPVVEVSLIANSRGMPQPQPLPSNLPLHFEGSKEINDAYSKILTIEQDTSAMISKSKSHSLETKLMRVRVLGYLIREAPSIKASEFVAGDVNRCPDERTIETLGDYYCVRFIRIFKANKGRTPAVSSHPSRPEFESKKELIKAMLLKPDSQPPRDHSTAKAKALVRDDFRCVFSGKYDTASVRQSRELKIEWENSGFHPCVTQCAHIIPSSINADTSGPDDKKREFAASVWTILECFGYEGLPERLKGAGIHNLDNVMTLGIDYHQYFDALNLWFEAEEGELNTYKVKSVDGVFLYGCKTENCIIRFEGTDNLPAPNPNYLRLHAVCCRVAHMSGAAEYIDKILDDLEDTDVLSEDGSSAHLLSFSIERQMIGLQVVAY